MMIPMVDLKRQYQNIKTEIDAAIASVIDSTQFIGGSAVKKFAANLADYLDVKHAIPCGNGTDAIQIALMALDLKPGDEVITTPFTFVATAEVIALLGLEPVFVDIHPDTFNIDENQIEKAITSKTRCIIPVHLFGQIANMEKICAIAKQHNLYVIEDNAQAIGANFTFSDGRHEKAGTIGDIGTTSFFPSKNLGAYGDGGAIFTNDDVLAEKIRLIANHGSKTKYYHDEVGVNSRLDAIQAAILDVKLKYLDKYSTARQKAALIYNALLAHIPGIQTPHLAKYSNHVYHQYTIIVEKGRNELQEQLKEAGIASTVYYPVSLHLQKAYSGKYQLGDYPVAEILSKKVLSLPMHTELEQSTQKHIIGHLLASIKQEI